MATRTYEGIVSNGQIRLRSDVQLKDNTKVYVLIPDEEDIPKARILTPHLADPAKARDFVLEVSEEASDASPAADDHF